MRLLAFALALALCAAAGVHAASVAPTLVGNPTAAFNSAGSLVTSVTTSGASSTTLVLGTCSQTSTTATTAGTYNVQQLAATCGFARLDCSSNNVTGVCAGYIGNYVYTAGLSISAVASANTYQLYVGQLNVLITTRETGSASTNKTYLQATGSTPVDNGNAGLAGLALAASVDSAVLDPNSVVPVGSLIAFVL